MSHNTTRISLYLLPVLLLLAASCSNTKYLPEGDSLYLGSKTNIKDDNVSGKSRTTLISDLNGVVRPKPNSKLLGVRLKLTIYNLAGDTAKKKGKIARAIRKFGEPPVLASTLDSEKNEKLMMNVLENKGFFYPTVTSRTETKKRMKRSYFDVNTGPQYMIRRIIFPSDTTQLSDDIAATSDKSLLKPDLPYNLDLIKGERNRIDKALAETGYYFFKADYLLVKVDSTVGNHKVDLYVEPKLGEVPDDGFKVYTINNVYVYPNYRINAVRQDTNKRDAVFYEGYNVIDQRKTFKPSVFKYAMQFKPGEMYNRTEQNKSLNRLVSMGTFKFVRNRFEPLDSNGRPLLDVYYYLTPLPKKSLRAELGVQSQTDSRVGSSISVSWRNRNAFKGAELLAVTLRGGFEAQSGGTIKRPPTFEGGIDVSLSIPRFVVPFINIRPSNLFIPRTTIRAGYDITLRQDLYLIHSGKLSYGYVWKEEIRKEHQFFPINVNYVRTDTLSQGLDQNINFSNIIFNGLIIGPTYEYTFNSQATGLRKHNFYFNGLVDFSNNITGLAQGASKDDPKKIFGTTYAQYMKYQVDGRYYMNYSPNKTDIWANRLIIGYGIPYGNSNNLPNIKQFFSGGNSSLRGFRSRLVGPGTFNALVEPSDGSGRFIETLGDIKLEFNTELRKNIYQFLNAAVFVDAGNIWLANPDPRFPGGEFTNKFLSQLAVDAGVGLRLDFQILLLRLDLGVPIRKPYITENNGFVIDQLNLRKVEGRKDNLILNLAIGYPF